MALQLSTAQLNSTQLGHRPCGASKFNPCPLQSNTWHLLQGFASDDLGCRRSPTTPDFNGTWTAGHFAAARRCLRGKKIWLLGNSVMRHWTFVLENVVTGQQSGPRKMSPMEKNAEFERCGRGGDFGGQMLSGSRCPYRGLCECVFEPHSSLGTGSTILFGWVWEIASPHLEQILLNGTGKHAPPDIVIYNAGYSQHACSKCKAGLREAKDDVPMLHSMVTRVLQARPELTFYWRSSTAQCDWKLGANTETRIINNHIEAYVCAIPRVRKLNTFAWTLDDKCKHYDDATHHSLLTWSHVLAFLRDYCAADFESLPL